MLAEVAKTLKDRGVDSHFLPKCHFSGCPSNCAVQQTAALGFRGAAKKVNGAMEPAFNVYAGGSYALGKGVVAEQIGTITSKNIPAFFLALNEVLLKAGQPYDEWYPSHQQDLMALIESFE